LNNSRRQFGARAYARQDRDSPTYHRSTGATVRGWCQRGARASLQIRMSIVALYCVHECVV